MRAPALVWIRKRPQSSTETTPSIPLLQCFCSISSCSLVSVSTWTKSFLRTTVRGWTLASLACQVPTLAAAETAVMSKLKKTQETWLKATRTMTLLKCSRCLRTTMKHLPLSANVLKPLVNICVFQTYIRPSQAALEQLTVSTSRCTTPKSLLF